MEVLKVITIILYLMICIALVAVVLMQEGKSGGLGALSGATDSYWGKNKGRTMEGALSKVTIVLATLFIVLSVVLNLKFW